MFEMFLFQGPTAINWGNRNRQVKHFFQAGTLAQENVVFINMAVWISFQSHSFIVQPYFISIFTLKFYKHSKRIRQLLKNGKNGGKYIYMYIYNLSKMSQTLEQFIIWEITINNTLIAKIKDYSTLNHLASILVKKGGFFWHSLGERRFFKRTVIFQLKPSYGGSLQGIWELYHSQRTVIVNHYYIYTEQAILLCVH